MLLKKLLISIREKFWKRSHVQFVKKFGLGPASIQKSWPGVTLYAFRSEKRFNVVKLSFLIRGHSYMALIHGMWQRHGGGEPDRNCLRTRQQNGRSVSGKPDRIFPQSTSSPLTTPCWWMWTSTLEIFMCLSVQLRRNRYAKWSSPGITLTSRSFEKDGTDHLTLLS